MVARTCRPSSSYSSAVSSAPAQRKVRHASARLEIPLSLLLLGARLVAVIQDSCSRTPTAGDGATVIVRLLLSLFLCCRALGGEVFRSAHQHRLPPALLCEPDPRLQARDLPLGSHVRGLADSLPHVLPEFAHEDYIITDSIEAMLKGRSPAIGQKRRDRRARKLVGNVGRLASSSPPCFGNIALRDHRKAGLQLRTAPIRSSSRRSRRSAAPRPWPPHLDVIRRRGSEAPLPRMTSSRSWAPAHREEAEVCFQRHRCRPGRRAPSGQMIRKVVEIGKERKPASEQHEGH